MKYFTVSDNRGSMIAAPAGYARNMTTGEVYRDCPLHSGPEMTRDSLNAYRFKTLRHAQQQAAKLAHPSIKVWE